MILEDSNEKVQNVFYKYPELLEGCEVHIARTVEQAKNIFWLAAEYKVRAFIDNEVCGLETGVDYLTWLLEASGNLIEVICISGSMNAAAQMVFKCNERKIPIRLMFP